MHRRRHERQVVDLVAELIWGEGKRQHDCTIEEISIGGARVRTRFYLELPNEIFLFEVGRDRLYRCDVRWRNRYLLGVRFEAICCSGASRDAAIDFIRVAAAAGPVATIWIPEPPVAPVEDQAAPSRFAAFGDWLRSLE